MNALNKGEWNTLRALNFSTQQKVLTQLGVATFPFFPPLLNGKPLLSWELSPSSAFELGIVANDSKTEILSLLRAGSPWRMGLCLKAHVYQQVLPQIMSRFRRG